jgi:hypothetical protein
LDGELALPSYPLPGNSVNTGFLLAFGTPAMCQAVRRPLSPERKEFSVNQQNGLNQLLTFTIAVLTIIHLAQQINKN